MSLKSLPDELRVIGRPRPRLDSAAKVLGATRYAGDSKHAGLLHARIVPSVYAHAIIKRLDTTAALATPGVVAVLRAADLPIVGRGEERRFEPLAAAEIVFAGQPVALVVAETEEAAEDGATLVRLESEPLEAVVDVVEAMKPGAPLVRLMGHGTAGATFDEVDLSSAGGERGAGDGRLSANVFSHHREERGDVNEGFARSAAIVSGRFRAGWAYQAHMEPHSATAWIEADGTLAVTSSTQGIFFTRNELAKIFGLHSSKVRVAAAAVGGAFGSKHVVVEPLAAAAALHLRRPVRLVLNRVEDFAATNPAPGMVIDLRIGADRAGRFQALEARMIYDGGAYCEWSWESFAAQLITGPYRWPAFDVVATGVRTNRFGAGNYRAPSGPEGVFALESLVDELAGRLGLDPVGLRMTNFVAAGESMADGEPWPGTGVADCLERLREHPTWIGREQLPPGEGVGLAAAVWLGSREPAAAVCRLEPDGRISVITGIVDISGATSGLALIAAETFGVPPEAVTIVTADSSSAPQSPFSAGSAITYGAGPAVARAAADARRRLLGVAAEQFEIEPGDLEIVDGIVRPRGSPEGGRPVAEFAEALSQFFEGEHEPVEGHASTRHSVLAPSAVAHLAHVRVDDETGSVELVGYAVAQDAGRALNPALVEGQMLGGTVQSIGRALSEELVHDERGQLLTGSFLDYAIPRAPSLPPIETLIVEVPAPEGPFGARGIGEASIVPGPAAIANAIAAASGVRLRELPMTARRVWAATRPAQSKPT